MFRFYAVYICSTWNSSPPINMPLTRHLFVFSVAWGCFAQAAELSCWADVRLLTGPAMPATDLSLPK